ncbi:MAG: hypothetical protein P4L33_05675 [Capsulimonadaceae bacterium]|nr:hypothetical protein [Capsulimonadaceae bacterium]
MSTTSTFDNETRAREASAPAWASLLVQHAHFIALLVVIAACVTVTHLHNAFISLFEGGGYLSGARRILDGQVPYRDFFLMYSPLRYYWAAFLLKATPSPIDAQWLFYDSLNFASAIAAYLTVRQFTQSKALQLLAPVAAFTWCAGSERMIFPLACVLLAALARRTGRETAMVGAGVAAALAGFTLQDLLPYTAAPVVVWLVVLLLIARNDADSAGAAKVVKLGGAFIGGIAAGTLPIVAAMAATHSLSAFVRDVYVIPMRHYNELPLTSFPKLTAMPEAAPDGSLWDRVPGGKLIIWSLNTLPFFFVPLVSLAAAGLSLSALAARRNRDAAAASLLVALLGLGLFRAVMMRPDLPHLHGNALPAALSAIGLLDILALTLSRRGGVVGKLGVLAVSAACVGMLFFLLYSPLKDLKRHAVTYQVEAGMRPRTTMDKWPQTSQVIEFVAKHSAPSDKVFYASTIPFLYVLTNRNNPTRYDYFDPIIAGEVEGDALRSLNADPPRYCVIEERQPLWKREFGRDFAVNIQRWIAGRYTPVQRYNDFVIYGRKPSSL